jgi:nitroimidazol reductase NimA-like FMN-containing flavoprotein (pyridoxamine 5'-phosphate oxidase superfamily)
MSNPARADLVTATTPVDDGHPQPAVPDTAAVLPGVRTLTEQECTELVALATVGRVGFVTPQGLQIIPLNVQWTGASMRLDTTPNSSLAQLADMGRDVSLEVDEYAAATGHGWSVLMQGKLGKLDHQGRLRPAAMPQRVKAQPGDSRTQALAFTPRSYSGRVVQHEPPQDGGDQPATDRSASDEQEKLS